MNLVALICRPRGRTWALGAVLVALSLLNSVLPQSPSVAQAAVDAPLDLAAMAPTALDLEADGFVDYTFWPAGSASSEGDIPYQVGSWTDECCFGDTVREGLDEAGLQQSYTFALTNKDPDDPRFAARGVYGSLNEFANADGAADAVAVIDEMSQVDTVTVERIDDSPQIGDATILVSETEYPQLTMVFQVDRLLVFLRIRDYKDAPPTVDEIETVAERWDERIETWLDADAPNLGSHALLLADDEYESPYSVGNDQYLRLAGEDRIFLAESEDQYTDRVEQTGDAIDVYAVGQYIQGADNAHPELPSDMFWASTIYRFADDEAASGWLEDQSEDLESSLLIDYDTEVQDIEFVDDAPVIGDESVALRYNEVEFSDCGCAIQIVRIRSRLGSVVTDVYLGTRTDQGIPVESVAALASFQVDCLASTACLEPVVLSDALAGSELVGSSSKIDAMLDLAGRQS